VTGIDPELGGHHTGVDAADHDAGYSARSSIRRFAVSALSACLDAEYAERNGASGSRPSIDETLMI